ncbi:cation:proton antiporter [Sphaerisporangium perillae]|uniref:cation:proton antiporter n=1 Tax=Sphaerisporangium perillae TaxID=2935860 RepID=UPI00200DCC06|nr:cation:proton antiporter [Sphaerisporangium perillae]
MDALLILPAIAVAVVLGGWVARRLNQPEVVVEIALCLALGGLLAGRLGWGVTESAGKDILYWLGHLGLALFLVGVGHQMREGFGRRSLRTVAWLSAGSVIVPLAAGALFAVWVLGTGDPLLRGGAPTPAFVLMLAIALTVTAVPVLAGILRDRGIQHTEDGRLALMSAAGIDVVTGILLAVAIGLMRGGDGLVTILVVLAGGAVTLLLRRLAATEVVSALADRHRGVLLVLVAAAGVAAALATQRLGLTEVFGAVIVGLALPARSRSGGPSPWTETAETLGRVGRALLPVLFVVTGTVVVAGPERVFSWQATVIATALAIAAKLGGAYAGARLGGRSPASGMRLAALMNTRGLTEIVVLQAGFSAGILSPALYLALLVMALVTTGLSGPLLLAAEWYGRTARGAAVNPNIRLVER